jgi:glycosyltransferase involved in cell wall biosynthesis
MSDTNYSVLIRTYNSEGVIQNTINSLLDQTVQPTAFIFVDSGSTDGTIHMLPKDSVVHTFLGTSFNYSDAINQGLKYVCTDFVMIISSHTSLHCSNAINYALQLLTANPEIGAAYFCDGRIGDLKYTLIDKRNFDGFNGLWNTCSIIKMNLLVRRNFRSEVFIAEDQEWARWLFHCEGKSIAQISGGGIKYANTKSTKHLMQKNLNQYVAIAYFANRNLLGWLNLARIAYRVVKPKPVPSTLEMQIYNFRPAPSTLEMQIYNLRLLCRLFVCHFLQPRCNSRYF